VTRARTMTSWALLVAMLLSLPASAAGRFVCTVGMVQSGPACPRCNGHESVQPSSHANAHEPGLSIGSACCRFEANPPAVLSTIASVSVDKPILAQSIGLLADARLGLAAPESNLAVHASRGPDSRAPASGHLSNFLRL